MVFNKRNKVRMLSGMIAASLAMLMVLSASTPVLAQGANTPTLNVGDSAYFGGIADIGEDYKAEMNEALKDFRDMGFDVKFDANGGAGAYFGWEVISNSADINGYLCYDIALMGAVGVDFGIDASAKGSYDMGEWGGVVTVDGKGDAILQFEATLDGHLFLTVDELAIAKIQMTLTADGNFEAHVDATMTGYGETMSIKADAEATINEVRFTLMMEFDPPIALFDFPVVEGNTWYVPAEDTYVTGSTTASGTISYDVESIVTGEPPYRDVDTVNLAVEIGTEIIDEIIPGGAPDYYWGYGGGMEFTCTKIIGNIATIEMDLFGMMDAFDMMMPGTRQFDMFDPESMMPSTGMQFDTTKGLPTSMTMDGEPMTSPTTQTEVENFIASPQQTVTSATGGAGGGMGGLLLIIVVVVVLVAVILVVVMVAKKKKTPPPQQYPPQQEMQQPMYGPQPGYEQPPPEYQPPPEQPQPGDYPPPPPPPGQ